MNLDRLLSGTAKITRAAFLYLEPQDSLRPEVFAQCKSCALFERTGLCSAMGRRVTASASCGMYMQGRRVHKPISTYTPEELGYVNTAVRCENCKWGGPGKTECRLFTKLNAQNPEIFDLDAKISPKGCCNGFQKS